MMSELTKIMNTGRFVGILITLRLNFNQVAMECTGLTHVGESLTGQLVTNSGRKKFDLTHVFAAKSLRCDHEFTPIS